MNSGWLVRSWALNRLYRTSLDSLIQVKEEFINQFSTLLGERLPGMPHTVFLEGEIEM